MFKKRFLYILLALMLGLFLAACGGAETPAGEPESAAEPDTEDVSSSEEVAEEEEDV